MAGGSDGWPTDGLTGLTSPVGILAFGIRDLIDGIPRRIERIGDFVEAFAIGAGRLFLQLVHFYRKIVEVTRDFVQFSVSHSVSLMTRPRF